MDSTLKILKTRQEDIFVSIASLMGAMAAPVRIRLIHFLSQAPLTVEVLAHKVNQSVANTSMHLRKLLNEGLVSSETLGQKRLYSLSPVVQDFWENYQSFAQKLNPTFVLATEDLYGDINWSKPWSETKRSVKSGEVILLDVRPQDEAIESTDSDLVIHIPQENLKENLKKLPKRKTILVFCRGRLCAMSAFTVNYLRENGFKAFRLDVSWNVLKKDIG